MFECMVFATVYNNFLDFNVQHYFVAICVPPFVIHSSQSGQNRSFILTQ